MIRRMILPTPAMVSGHSCTPSMTSLLEVIDLGPLISTLRQAQANQSSTDGKLAPHASDSKDNLASHTNLNADLHIEVIAKQVSRCLQTVGFLYIRNHGVDASLLREVFQASASFFDQPESVKRQCSYRAPVPRGYVGLDKENFAKLIGQQRPNDLVEKLRFGPFDIPLCDVSAGADPNSSGVRRSADHAVSPDELSSASDVSRAYDERDMYYYRSKEARELFFANVFPKHPPGLEPLLRLYFAAMERLMRALLTLFEIALQLPPGYFTSKVSRHSSILSLNHYPHVKVSRSKRRQGQLRIAAHTDVDMFTILAQDDAPGGLEVCTRSGEWVAVPAIPGTLVVNIGDCMQQWTNDVWLSTVHRVVLPPDEDAEHHHHSRAGDGSAVALTALDNEVTTHVMRVREWYGWHFPELARIVPDLITYAMVVRRLGSRDAAGSTDLSDILSEEVEREVRTAAQFSMGIDICQEDLINIFEQCDRAIAASARVPGLPERPCNR